MGSTSSRLPPAPATSGVGPHRASVLLFCAGTFFFWASLYLYVPVLPVYAQRLGASLPVVGVVIASYAIAQLTLRIPIGVWADAMGSRKLWVVVGTVMTTLGALGLAVAPNPWLLFLARALTGVAAATWVAFTVLFASYYPREESTRAIGNISFVNGAALVASTLAGGLVVEAWGYRAVFLGAALLGVLALAAVLPAREVAPPRLGRTTWAGFLRVATHPLLLSVSAMSSLLQFTTFAGIFSFIPVYAEGIGASPAALGVITMLALASSALAALTVVHVAARWGYAATILVGAVLLAGALASIPWVQHVAVLGVVQVLNGVGRGLLTTAFMALSIRAVAPEQRATAMGVYQALYSVGMLLGPLVSGFLAQGLGLASVFYLCAALSAVVGAGAFLPVVPRRRAA